MQNFELKPLFRWAGGKSKMIKHYLPYFPEKVDSYVEPFLGAGSMFLYIKKTFNPKKIHLNDINGELMCIYKDIQAYPEEFIKEVKKLEAEYLPLSKDKRKEFYYKWRDLYIEEYNSQVLFFLLKTCFNGIWQTANASKGMFYTPAGLLNETKIVDEDQILGWSQALKGVILTHESWEKVSGVKDSFIFADPPYRDSFTTYGKVFTDDHQLKLLNELRGSPNSVFLCNKDCRDDFFSEKNIKPFSKIEIEVTHTAGRRKKEEQGFSAKKATEILLYK